MTNVSGAADGQPQITAAMVKQLRDETGAGMMDAKRALTEANGDREEAVKILRKKGLASAAKKAGRIASEGAVHAYASGNTGVLVEVNSETDFVARTDQFRSFLDDVAKFIASSKAKTVEELNNEQWDGVTVLQKTQELVAKIGENVTVRRFERYEAPQGGTIGSYIHAGGKVGVMVELVANDGGGKGAEVARDVAMHVAAAEPRFLNRDQVTQKDLDTEREIARDAAAKSGKPENIVEKMVTGKMEKFYGEACLLEQPYIRNDKQSVSDYLKAAGKDANCAYTVTRFVRYKLGEGIEKPSGPDFASEVMSYMK
jgi:elongation factor Ts